MARRAGGGSTIVGPKDVTPEQEQARLDESLAALRATAAKGQAEFIRFCKTLSCWTPQNKRPRRAELQLHQ